MRQVLSDNPQMYLPLGAGGLTDLSGHGHEAVAYGTPGTGLWVDGVSASSTFNGTDQYLEVADHPALSPTFTGILTIEAWMAPGVLTFPVMQGDDQYVHWFGKSDDPNRHEYAMRMYRQVPTIEPERPNRISGYSFNPPGGLGAGSYSQDVVVANQWMHFVLIINTVDTSPGFPTGYTKLYKNGVQRDKDSLSGYFIIPQDTSSPLRIATTNLTSFLQGRMAQVAVYNYELPAQRVSDHYRYVVPSIGGSAAFERHVGDISSTEAASTTFDVMVGPSGVPAGAFLVASSVTPYTALVATVSDSRENVWPVDAQRADNASTVRTAIYSAQVNNALREGDTIRLTTTEPVDRAAFTVDQFRDLAFVGKRASTNTQGAGTDPSIALAPGAADGIVHTAIGVAGPTTDAYTAGDSTAMVALGRYGTAAGTNDVFVTGAYKSIGDGSAVQFSPTLGTSRPWSAVAAGYQAGTPTPVPVFTGSAQHLQALTSGTSSTSGTTLVLTVPTAAVAGQTLICSVSADYTAAAPSVTDSAGHVWGPADRSGPMPGNVGRASLFSCVLDTPMPAGATITITWATPIVHKAALVGLYAGLAVPKAINVAGSASAASGSPNFATTTTVADPLAIAVVAMAGPADARYAADIRWLSEPTVGTSGAGAADKTLYTSYKIIGPVATATFAPKLQGSYAWAALTVVYAVTAPPVVVPPPGPAAYAGALGSATSSDPGRTLTVTVPASIPAGQTAVAYLTGDYTAAAPTILDDRGNTWRLLRSSPYATQARTGIYLCVVETALQAGDTITMTWSTIITHRAVLLDRYTGVLTPLVVDYADSRAGSSPSPSITSRATQADTLVLACAGITGPASDSYLPALGFTQTGRVGTSDAETASDDRTIIGGYVSAPTAATRTYAPALGVARGWVAVTASVVAGTPVTAPGFTYTAGQVHASDGSPGISYDGTLLTVDSALAPGVRYAAGLLTVTTND